MMIIPSDLRADFKYLLIKDFWFDTMKVAAGTVMTGKEIHDMLAEYFGTMQAVHYIGRRIEICVMDSSVWDIYNVLVAEGKIIMKSSGYSSESRLLYKVLMGYPIAYIPQVLDTLRGSIGYDILTARLKGDL